MKRSSCFFAVLAFGLGMGCRSEQGLAPLAPATLPEELVSSSAPIRQVASEAPLPIAQDAGAPAAAKARPGAYANLDPSDDDVVGPPEVRVDCEAALTQAGVTFRVSSLPVRSKGSGIARCGAPQVVTYVRGPTGLRIEPTPVVTCGMALALASFEGILQEEAKRVFETQVVRVEQIGTYACRDIARFKGMVSEHAYANAIDLTTFVLQNGRVLHVLGDFDMSDGPPTRPGGDFLRAISRRAQDEDVFSNVLTAFWDAAHKNHFHLDLARYRVEGVRRR